MKVAAVLTVSDRCSTGETVDKSGPAIVAALESSGWIVKETAIVADDKHVIQQNLRKWSSPSVDDLHLVVNLIVTTGGTGFGVRDVTPEAVSELIEKQAPGLSMAMMFASLAKTPLAALSRPCCGVIGKTIVVTLPGSVKGALENFHAILDVLQHAVDLASGSSGESFHSKMNDINSSQLPSSTPVHHHHHHRHSCGKAHHEHKPHSGKSDGIGVPVAKRSRQSPFPMVSFDQAVATVSEKISQQQPADHAAPTVVDKFVDESLVGHVIAQDVFAAENVPAFRASIVDGYAVIASDGARDFQVVSSIHAGSSASTATTTTSTPSSLSSLTSGLAVRITTGAPLPSNATAVVMVEDTELLSSSPDGSTELSIRVTCPVSDSENVREIGSDTRRGELVLQKGTLVTQIGGEIGVLVSCGVVRVKVYKKPVVAVLSTGNELVDLSAAATAAEVDRQKLSLEYGQIWDSNRPSLMAAIRAAGFEVIDLGIVRDGPNEIEEALKDGFSRADFVISSGGVSMGEYDFLKSILEEKFQGKIEFGRVAMKPGKPTTFCVIPPHPPLWNSQKFMFALPGNPVSALVTFQLFALPALKLFAGYSSTLAHSPRIRVKITHDIERLDSRPEFLRAIASATTTITHNVIEASAIAGIQRSSRLASMCRANVLLALPAADTGNDHQSLIKAGEEVEAVVVDRIGF